jgi:hypothetical protein
MTLIKRRAWTALSLIVLTLGSASRGAQAKDTPAHIAARRAIETAYKRCAHASLKNDLPKVMSLFTPDFHYIGLDGNQLDYGQYMTLFRNKTAVKGLQYDSIKQSIQRMEWRGEDVAIWSLTSTNTSYKGNRLSMVGHVRDYWRHTPKGWAVSQSVALDASTWMNGKLISKTP